MKRFSALALTFAFLALAGYLLGFAPQVINPGGGSSLATPVSVANGGTGIASGTSGGVPYYSGATTIASSGALTANRPVIGGGAGAAPGVGTVTGNTTQFPTWTGATTASRCVHTDASGNLIIAAADCAGALPALSDNGTVVITTEPIAFGGATNSFPMITTNGTQLRIKLGDDSGFTSLYAGGITGFSYATDSNCAAVGTAANPSVASCGAAPAGAFSCATNASTGTCQVNSSAVTANSNILVQQVSYLNTRLSVTCNTGTVLPTGPLTTAISAGSSFTITLGAFATNPGCFVYWITN